MEPASGDGQVLCPHDVDTLRAQMAENQTKQVQQIGAASQPGASALAPHHDQPVRRRSCLDPSAPAWALGTDLHQPVTTEARALRLAPPRGREQRSPGRILDAAKAH